MDALERDLLRMLALPDEPESAERAIAWAVDAIVAGKDSPSLRMLAGLVPELDRDDAPGLLRATLRELSIEPVGDPWELYARDVLDRLLARTLPLHEAVVELWQLDQVRFDGPLSRIASMYYYLDEVDWDVEAEARAEAARVRAELGPPPSAGPFR